MPEADNIALSPFSVGLTLAMVSAGAESSTLDQIRDALHLSRSSSQDDINQAFSQVLTSIGSDSTFTLLTANRFYVENDFLVKGQFVDDLKNYYQAGVIDSDFGTDITDEINEWISSQTKNKITDLLNRGDIHAMSRLVIVNAIYFQSKWKVQFDEQLTQEETFYLTNGDEVQVPMMSISEGTDFKFIEIPGLDSTVLQLNYESGRVVMYIILPNEKGEIKKVKSNLNSKTFDSIVNNQNTENFDTIKLPKFTIKKKENMKSILEELNVKDLFNEDTANLDGIADLQGSNLFADNVYHEAFVNVNEQGTEAGAATALSLGFRTLYEQQFIANHPFIFVIFDTETNSILFIGEVNDPSK